MAYYQRPEIVEDFVRNFLVKMGMTRTLDCFQTEWWAEFLYKDRFINNLSLELVFIIASFLKCAWEFKSSVMTLSGKLNIYTRTDSSVNS